MKRHTALIIFLAVGIGISLGWSVRVVAHAAHQGSFTDQVVIAAALNIQHGPNSQHIRLAKDNGESEHGNGKVVNGDKSDKPDLRYVDWSKSSSIQAKIINGNGNELGEEEQDEEEAEKEEEETDEEEGFDRLWDVVLYG